MALEIKFPDGSLKEFPDDSTGYDIAKSISERLAQDPLAVSIDGLLKDINGPLKSGGQIQIHTFDSPIGKQGEFYLENVPSGRHEAIIEHEGSVCRFMIEVPLIDVREVKLGTLRCSAR